MKKLILLFMVFALPLLSVADNFDDLLQALRNGNAKEIVKNFNANIELTLLDNEGIYSKQQAEQMLRSFSTKYPAKQVNFQHKGASGQGAQYAIANYESSNGKFRAYVFMKDAGNGQLNIHEFRIERE